MFTCEYFTWLHLGKTAGTSTRVALKEIFPDSILIEDSNPLKHCSLSDAQKFKLKVDPVKPVSIGFRKLADWARSHLQQQFGVKVPTAQKHNLLKGKLELGKSSKAKQINLFTEVKTLDQLLNYYLDDIEPNFIRTEFLLEDFVAFFNKYGIPIKDKKKLNYFKKNVNKRQQLSDIPFFSNEELQILYDNSPLWADLESKLYTNYARN